MKLYIATPISARQEPTMREKLVAAKRRVEMLKEILADDVRFKNYELISTFDFNDRNDTEEKAMSRCIYHVLTSDAIYLDHGWTASKGCNLEYLTAKIYGKLIIEHSEHKTKETMKTEENKRMLALSYIVADLKAENMELEQRVHQLEDDYNDVVSRLNGNEKRKDEDPAKLLLDNMQKMRDHCDKLEKDNEQLKRQCVQLQTERNEAKTHADECELQKEELFKHIARFENSEFLKIGDDCTYRNSLPFGIPVTVGSGKCRSCPYLIKVDEFGGKCVLCACRYDNTKAEEAQECKPTDD